MTDFWTIFARQHLGVDATWRCQGVSTSDDLSTITVTLGRGGVQRAATVPFDDFIQARAAWESANGVCSWCMGTGEQACGFPVSRQPCTKCDGETRALSPVGQGTLL